MKKYLPVIMSVVGVMLIIAFLAWAFAQHGTIGLYRVNGFFAGIFNIFGILGIVLLGTAVFLWWRKSSGRDGFRWVTVIAVILSIPAIVIPLAAFALLGGIVSGDIGDTPPRLVITDTVGESGIPDMALVYTTAQGTSDNLVLYEDNEEGVPLTFQEDELSTEHVFILPDLQPDTLYHYWINNSQAGSFTTPPLDGSLRFAVASDAHYGARTARNDLTSAMLDDIADPENGMDAFFLVGDIVEYGFLTEQWQEAFRSLSTVTGTVPSAFAPGNHDTLFSGFGRYLDYCCPEEIEMQSGSRLWYRFDIGPVHFLVLDLEWSAESFSDEQADWLEIQLADIPDDEWKIVMSHGYYYASGLEFAGWNWYDNPETIERLVPLFREYGVDIVFSGHNHRLELLQESGVLYVNCGAFGGLPDLDPTYVSPYSLWDGSGGYAFADVVVEGDECTIVYRGSDFEALHTLTFSRE